MCSYTKHSIKSFKLSGTTLLDRDSTGQHVTKVREVFTDVSSTKSAFLWET